MTVETTTKPAGTTTAFPKAEVEAKLKEVLLGAAQSDAALKGIALPSDTAGQAAASVQLELPRSGVVALRYRADCGVRAQGQPRAHRRLFIGQQGDGASDAAHRKGVGEERK